MRTEDGIVRCVAVGRMTAKKAPILTLDGFRRAAEVCPELRLDYVGTGQLLTAAQQFVRAFNLVQLLFNGLAEFDVVDISQDENRFDNLAELFQRFVQRMLLRVRIESLEQL